jgi:hypothetical protein
MKPTHEADLLPGLADLPRQPSGALKKKGAGLRNLVVRAGSDVKRPPINEG